jgi:Deoxyxylulose-5-phosphate synthase
VSITKSTRIKTLDTAALVALSEDIRKEIIEVTTKNGGHLSSNLGVVELTVALHYVFDFPKDKLLFDVGHQCYAHKILTRDGFSLLRKKGGISGFPKPSESEFDEFYSGHSGTALSQAAGLVRARAIKGENFEVISVIGDGSLMNGNAFEALNDEVIGKQIIIINDNKMTIGNTRGRLRAVLDDAVKAKNYFKLLGYDYLHLPCGHDMNLLINLFKTAKNSTKSVILHIDTEKGKGYIPAENDPAKFHSKGGAERSYASVFSDTLISLAETDARIVAVTAAMCDATGLSGFSKRFPTRFFDVGIAEGHAVTMCAALAKQGLKPVFAVYGSFLQRSFDQLLLEISSEKLPVVLCVDHAGFVSDDGETHQGLTTVGYLRQAGITTVTPKNFIEFESMLKWALLQDIPVAIRYPKGSVNNALPVTKIELGKWDTETEGTDGTILFYGARLAVIASKLKASIMNKGLNLSTVNARFQNPVDYEMLEKLKNKGIFVLEDNILAGGLLSAITEYYATRGVSARVGVQAFSTPYIPAMTDAEAYGETFDLAALTDRITEFFNAT